MGDYTMFPVSRLGKLLELSSSEDFQAILRCLADPLYCNEKLLKTHLPLLVTKIRKLLRSSEDVEVWKGCHAAVVLCSYNPLVLCTHGGELLADMFNKLEPRVKFYESVARTPQSQALLQTLATSIGIVMDLMRGKPSLSRESLVPNMKVIIPVFVTLAQYEPKLVLPILQKCLYKHSTTFKPFATKFRSVLKEILIKQYSYLDATTRSLVCNNFAYLHLIKIHGSNVADNDTTQSHFKTYPDDTWHVALLAILSQFRPLILMCGELLDLTQDPELQKLIECLPKTENIDDKLLKEFSLPVLKLDLNLPETLWTIPSRLNLLADLLISLFTLPTPYPLRIPLGSINTVCETLLSLSRNYLPIQRELRHSADLSSVIDDILPQLQYGGIRIWTKLLQTYQKSCLSYIPSMLGSLEYFVPLGNKTSKIDQDKCLLFSKEFTLVFQLVTMAMQHTGHKFGDLGVFNKLMDVAMILTNDVSLIHNIDSQVNEKMKMASKKTSKKENSAATLSDIYTSAEKFVIETDLLLLDKVNHYICCMLSVLKLPTAKQVAVINYAVKKSMRLKEQIGHVPQSFVDLLRTLVLFPGNEKVSILPIAISILRDSADPVLDSICHPKLPNSGVYRIRVEKLDSSLEEDEETVEEKEHVVEDVRKAQIDETQQEFITKPKSKALTSETEITATVDVTKVFKAHDREEVAEELREVKRQKLDTETTQRDVPLQAVAPPVVEDDDDEVSDFEMPEINVDDDDEEDEEDS